MSNHHRISTLAVLALATVAAAGCASRRNETGTENRGFFARTFDRFRHDDRDDRSFRLRADDADARRAPVSVRTSPPPLRDEEMGTRPSLQHQWLPGYWRPEGDNWTWVPGRWEVPPQGTTWWAQPSCSSEGESTVWTPGGWR